MIVTQAGADALELVGSHRYAHPAATHQNAALRIPGPDIFRNQDGVIGIIVRFTRFKSAYIVNGVTEFLDDFDQLPFHVVTCVVCPDGNIHGDK